jgi:hypothetical protein
MYHFLGNNELECDSLLSFWRKKKCTADAWDTVPIDISWDRVMEFDVRDIVGTI